MDGERKIQLVIIRSPPGLKMRCISQIACQKLADVFKCFGSDYGSEAVPPKLSLCKLAIMSTPGPGRISQPTKGRPSKRGRRFGKFLLLWNKIASKLAHWVKRRMLAQGAFYKLSGSIVHGDILFMVKGQ